VQALDEETTTITSLFTPQVLTAEGLSLTDYTGADAIQHFPATDNKETAMLGIGPTELIVVLVIALLIFGPKKLPELARSLGGGMREFKNSVTGNDRHDLPPADGPKS
jgi:TatA/E family protein of Tat protein translocase